MFKQGASVETKEKFGVIEAGQRMEVISNFDNGVVTRFWFDRMNQFVQVWIPVEKVQFPQIRDWEWVKRTSQCNS